jgi:hypothetical protein
MRRKGRWTGREGGEGREGKEGREDSEGLCPLN